jgi:hypothetical protein
MKDKLIGAAFYWVPIMFGGIVLIEKFGTLVFFTVAAVAFAVCIIFSDL